MIYRAGDAGANFIALPCYLDVTYQRAGINDVACFQTCGEDARFGGGHDVRLEHGDDSGVAGIVLEADEGEGGVALDHGIGIVEHWQKSLVKFWRSVVLAHYPGVGYADFFDGIRRERNDLRIPLADGGIAAFDAGFELREHVLDFAGMGTVG